MLLKLKQELMRVRQNFMASMGQTTPAKEFGATLLMAVVGLHVTEARIRKTQNFEERRRLINEFNRQMNAIEKGIRLLRKSSRESSKDPGERRKRAMP
jgi:xanthine dehydrogenase molybdopterin-binding subunit B